MNILKTFWILKIQKILNFFVPIFKEAGSTWWNQQQTTIQKNMGRDAMPGDRYKLL